MIYAYVHQVTYGYITDFTNGTPSFTNIKIYIFQQCSSVMDYVVSPHGQSECDTIVLASV